MKAQDITPGDYEVRQYKGAERKATITKVEKRTIRVMPAGSYQSYPSELWRAIEILPDGKEFLWSLAQVIRPWSEAAPERAAAEADARIGRQGRHNLQDTLRAIGIDVQVTGSETYGVVFTREQADLLVHHLDGPQHEYDGE